MMSSLTFYYWKNREEYINTGYAVTGWMLIVITQICEYALVNAKRAYKAGQCCYQDFFSWNI